MSALNLPKPVNSYAGQDELRNVAPANGNGTPNGDDAQEDEGEYRPPRPSDQLKIGIIYPPKEIRTIVDKTATHISKSPTPLLLEEKIRDFQKHDPKFAFLNDADPFHQYYRYMVQKAKEDVEDAVQGIVKPQEEKKEVKVEESKAKEPKAWEFKVDMPGVTAQDLDILRLTALFHARRGRSFLSSLSVKEGRNYQFDFLRPTHSLYGYYNRMVESYSKVINPPPGLIDGLVKEAKDEGSKWKTLEEARNRAEWERGRRKRENDRAKEEEEDAKAMAAIDWQDFVTVETIEFTQADEALELPPPTSIQKLKSMSLAEKRMAAMVMEETGAGPTQANGQQDEMEIEEDEEDEDAKTQRIKAEQEQARAREVQRAAMEQRGMKIKKDYVPKGLQRTTSVSTATCPNCGQLIPEDQLSEHMRIELLDPKWKEQKKQQDLRRAQHQQLAQGADIAASLKNLASARTDIFGDDVDEATRRAREEEEKQKRREREKIVWDGHTASAAQTTETFQSQFSLEDQIKKMHSRMGLDNVPANSPGPQIGPGMSQHVPTPMAAGLPTPGGGTAYAGATISAAPTGPSTREYISTPYDPAAFGGQSPGVPPSIHPSRLAAMGPGSGTPPVAGQVHPRDDDGASAPAFKRPKIQKLPYGQLYSETDWANYHPDPIKLSVQLPVMPEKPEWKLDGSIIEVPDLPVGTLFSTVRERIKRVMDADLPISRMRLDWGGKPMSNGSTLASVNLDDEDTIVLVLKKK
ncbi:splicing factor 3A subunit 1 [Cryptococcus wingfieldii CBS 7118]|uniref:Splicing factor 3A subunit 1 n=1 Tax=Cryptococcus wingfieldii CBS 7118 TaxID=1295528 RepID=A0A1E3K7Q1_9TREE|nr:splicing factor 3A subunit 1 [Cryptococcus wingfieldii CBS 7118]ODO08883.1 splicing factor 3A subunit 1 [Cryptococcus wingfieldii CBS 7118]